MVAQQEYLPFLPAALEIRERPPHPLARWTAITLMLFFLLLVIWSCIGRVDVVAIAEGKIIPSARVKQIQPLEKGVVGKILVHEGQRVREGDALVILDRTSSGAERDRLAIEVRKAEENLNHSQEFLALLDGSTDRGSPLVEQQWKQFLAERSGLQSRMESQQAERRANREIMHKLQATLPIASRRANDMKKLSQKKMVAENQYLEQEEIRISQQQDLAAATARDEQFSAAIAEAEQQLLALEAQTRSKALGAVTDAGHQVDSLREQLRKAEDFDARQVLYAPVSGRIKDLAVNTVGGVVMEAQQLMLIVPEDEALEVEAWLPNQDVGFVHENDAAIIKVHTFPFTRYGTIAAQVKQVSDDAIQDERTAHEKGGLLYRIAVQLAQDSLLVDGRSVHLMPGMQVSVEIITGQRRIIDYFLTPLRQRVQESGRER